MQVLLRVPDMALRQSLCTSLKTAQVDFCEIEAEDLLSLGRPTGAGWEEASLIVGDHPKIEDEVRALRDRGYRNNVLGATRGHQPLRAAKLLGIGCDDVLVTPADPQELVARIAATGRRALGYADSRVVIGDLTIHFDGREPEVKGAPIRLSNRESAIFMVLAKHHGRVVSREMIYNAVYSLTDRQPFDKVIDVFICKIRRKLEETTGHPYIQTVFGRGYMLEDPAHEIRRLQAAAENLRRVGQEREVQCASALVAMGIPQRIDRRRRQHRALAVA